MSLAWSATITCDRCQRRLIVESATRSPIDGPYVRDVAQHQGWTPLRRNGSQYDLCPDCAPEQAE